MKKERVYAIINCIVIYLVLFIAFQILKLKSNLINYVLLAVIIGIILYLYPKLFDKN